MSSLLLLCNAATSSRKAASAASRSATSASAATARARSSSMSLDSAAAASSAPTQRRSASATRASTAWISSASDRRALSASVTSRSHADRKSCKALSCACRMEASSSRSASRSLSASRRAAASSFAVLLRASKASCSSSLSSCADDASASSARRSHWDAAARSCSITRDRSSICASTVCNLEDNCDASFVAFFIRPSRCDEAFSSFAHFSSDLALALFRRDTSLRSVSTSSADLSSAMTACLSTFCTLLSRASNVVRDSVSVRSSSLSNEAARRRSSSSF
mmetsp:Transcript_17750/g.52746  ORF Transcript_17750/g.52746 Transcript_17750/m.52746 type:complete len:280 (+) Transcript_17750:1122-1961(+)